MKDLSELDQIISNVSSRLGEAASLQARLEDDLQRMRKQLEEKELDKIRAVKEKDRVIEELEREKMGLQKEKEALESKIDDFFSKMRALMPGADFERRQN